GKPEEAETNRGSFRLDEDGRAVAQTKTSWISASGLDVHAGSGDLQLSSHADADSEVCLKGAQRPELHASGRNQNKYQTPRTRESATKRAGPCSIEIFQHPASDLSTQSSVEVRCFGEVLGGLSQKGGCSQETSVVVLNVHSGTDSAFPALRRRHTADRTPTTPPVDAAGKSSHGNRGKLLTSRPG